MRALHTSPTSGTDYQKDQAESAYQEVLRQFRECGELANMGGENRLIHHLS